MVEIISELISYSVASSPTTALKIVQKDGKVFTTRLSINILLLAPFGVGKSSFLRAVEDVGLGVKVDEYTLPAIVGTIKKSGEVVEGYVVRSAGKVLLIDEFQKCGKREKEALLSLMEDHEYTRTLGYQVAPPVKRQNHFYELIGEGNYFRLKVRNSFLIGTMAFKKRTIEDKALLSRSFPLIIHPTVEDALNILIDGSVFRLHPDVKKWHEKSVDAVVEIHPNVSKVLTEQYKSLVDGLALETGFITRGILDITRIAGMMAVIDGRSEITEEDVIKAMKFAPLQILGYNLGYLTPAQLDVYSVIAKHPEGIRQKEVIEQSQYQRRIVIDSLAVLLGAGLIEQYKIGKAVFYRLKKVGGGSK